MSTTTSGIRIRIFGPDDSQDPELANPEGTGPKLIRKHTIYPVPLSTSTTARLTVMPTNTQIVYPGPNKESKNEIRKRTNLFDPIPLTAHTIVTKTSIPRGLRILNSHPFHQDKTAKVISTPIYTYNFITTSGLIIKLQTSSRHPSNERGMIVSFCSLFHQSNNK